MLRLLAVLPAVAMIASALLDAFETIIQPRRVTRRVRFARFYYRATWGFFRHVALSMKPGKRREALLAAFGPMSLLGLFIGWVIILILGFGLLDWSLHLGLHGSANGSSLWTYLYFSGITFFTAGYGDVTPAGPFGRALAVTESGLGFGFLAAVISYLPAMSQAYSDRELTINLFDARAGSPPSAAELLVRLGHSGNLALADQFLQEWERWAGELLESQLSYPVLGYYRSQHDNQSWLSTLTCILDACSILIVHQDRKQTYQAQLTFAMARHAAVDLGLVLFVAPPSQIPIRLSDPQKQKLYAALRDAGIAFEATPDADVKLNELRGLYEPFIFALADRLLYSVPNIIDEQPNADNWQRSAWMSRSPGIGRLPSAHDGEEHFG
jgi:hypothetical protein